jgi:hypothetical protein
VFAEETVAEVFTADAGAGRSSMVVGSPGTGCISPTDSLCHDVANAVGYVRVYS